ncbi:alpha/beta fold hydrolase [Bradyrhizobium genosp. P]|uniref:alpha/beta fold hydrolase n=1 Tax=Bradyrhizobium genosp. P TaxID=83641 RepID=UPI003CE6BD30
MMEAISAAKRPISAAFTYAENYVSLYGSRLHYVDIGAGDPFLFLHGNPTWSYCWRNVIPHLDPLGRCVAPDFIGFGKSDHPDIAYRIFDQIRYIEEFVVQPDLRNITLIIHDWGALVGLNLARRFPGRVRAVAFCEFPVKPLGTLQETWPLIAEEFSKFRSPAGRPQGSDIGRRFVTSISDDVKSFGIDLCRGCLRQRIPRRDGGASAR